MSSPKRRIGLIAEGPTGRSALESLLADFQVAFVVRSGGDEDAVVKLARSAGVEVLQCSRPSELLGILESYRPELTAISSFSRILPEDLVSQWDFINVHYSPLPEYRGRANVNWAIINGEAMAAITVHRIIAGLDAGPILVQQFVPIGPRATATDLYEALNDLQQTALPRAVWLRLGGDSGTPQDESRASYACTRLPEDGLISWSDSSVEIDRLVRALTKPFPGAYTYYGLRKLEVRRACPVSDPPHYVGRIPGRVIGFDRVEGWVDVLAGEGVLRVFEVALDGVSMAAATIVRSVKSTLGIRVDELMQQLPLVSPLSGAPSSRHLSSSTADSNASQKARGDIQEELG